jgi:hypothetical protein
MSDSAGDGGKSVRAVLDAWREQQADRVDPVRFHFIETMASRANDHRGEVRRMLDERLSKLLEAYARDLERTQSEGANFDSTPPSREIVRGALGGLLEHIGNHKAAITMNAAVTADQEDDGSDSIHPSHSEELPALLEFRKIWSKVRTDGQLRQSLEQVPANAGPLNSGVLVHRSIMLMRELSPEYLRHFLSYVDTLSWMEQMHGSGVLEAAVSPVAGSSQHARNKPRRRRD